ncbi:MAG: hypothetical protein ACR2KZ_02600, partial [Segetibacter sp.]
GLYYCLIYNIKLELPMDSELLLIAPTSCRHNAKPIVSGSCLSLMMFTTLTPCYVTLLIVRCGMSKLF